MKETMWTVRLDENDLNNIRYKGTYEDCLKECAGYYYNDEPNVFLANVLMEDGKVLLVIETRKTMWSVQLSKTDWSNDTFRGTKDDCENYIKNVIEKSEEFNFDADGRARLACIVVKENGETEDIITEGTTWSVQLECSGWNDDVFNGSFEECIEYCKKSDYRLDGKEARLMKILTENAYVLQALEEYTEYYDDDEDDENEEDEAV